MEPLDTRELQQLTGEGFFLYHIVAKEKDNTEGDIQQQVLQLQEECPQVFSNNPSLPPEQPHDH